MQKGRKKKAQKRVPGESERGKAPRWHASSRPHERENRGNSEVGRGKFPIKRPPLRRAIFGAASLGSASRLHGPITKQ